MPLSAQLDRRALLRRRDSRKPGPSSRMNPNRSANDAVHERLILQLLSWLSCFPDSSSSDRALRAGAFPAGIVRERHGFDHRRRRRRSVRRACIPAASAAASASRLWLRIRRGICRRSFASARRRLRRRRRWCGRRCCRRRSRASSDLRPTPPPSSMRSVIFFIQSEPSRQGVHWPQLSWA